MRVMGLFGWFMRAIPYYSLHGADTNAEDPGDLEFAHAGAAQILDASFCSC